MTPEIEVPTRYYYCWIRKDIPFVCQLIQLSHASLEIGLDSNRVGVAPYHLCLFEVADERELKKVRRKLQKEIPDQFTCFYEPDWPKGFTSIATRPFSGAARNIFKGYTLYRVADEEPEVVEHRNKVHVTD